MYICDAAHDVAKHTSARLAARRGRHPSRMIEHPRTAPGFPPHHSMIGFEEHSTVDRLYDLLIPTYVTSHQIFPTRHAQPILSHQQPLSSISCPPLRPLTQTSFLVVPTVVLFLTTRPLLSRHSSFVTYRVSPGIISRATTVPAPSLDDETPPPVPTVPAVDHLLE